MPLRSGCRWSPVSSLSISSTRLILDHRNQASAALPPTGAIGLKARLPRPKSYRLLDANAVGHLLLLALILALSDALSIIHLHYLLLTWYLHIGIWNTAQLLNPEQQL
jgi:hypothetical protein